MKILLKAKNTTLTPALKTFIGDKIVVPVTRHLGGNAENALVEVEIGKSTKHHQKGLVWYAEVNVSFGKQIIRVESFAEDVREAIDDAARELKEDVTKFKTKRVAKNRTKERAAKRRMKGA